MEKVWSNIYSLTLRIQKKRDLFECLSFFSIAKKTACAELASVKQKKLV